MELLVLLTNFDLKLSFDIVFTISSGGEFRSFIVCGKNDNLKNTLLCSRNYKLKSVATSGSSFIIWF